MNHLEAYLQFQVSSQHISGIALLVYGRKLHDGYWKTGKMTETGQLKFFWGEIWVWQTIKVLHYTLHP